MVATDGPKRKEMRYTKRVFFSPPAPNSPHPPTPCARTPRADVSQLLQAPAMPQVEAGRAAAAAVVENEATPDAYCTKPVRLSSLCVPAYARFWQDWRELPTYRRKS